MYPIKAAIAAFFVVIPALFLVAPATADDEVREMVADGGVGSFVITNQPCQIDFHEPTDFKWDAYVVLPDGLYAACWYMDDAGVWIAVDHFHQITILDFSAFKMKPPQPKQESF